MKVIYLVHPRGISKRMRDEIRDIPGLEVEERTDWEGMSPEELADCLRGYEVLILSRDPIVPPEIAADPGNLKYICYLHGAIGRVLSLPIVQSPIRITNWGDHPGAELAMLSLVLLMALLKDLPTRILAVRRGEGKGINSVGATVKGLRVGLYGYGFAGRKCVELLLPLGAEVKIFDPYATGIPDACTRVDTLEALFEGIHAVMIHAALTPETRGSVTAKLLSRLPDQGLVINTARGGIIDQPALFAELKSGRLRAGLDVLDPDHLEPDHEARQWENLIWTCHHGGGAKAWPGAEETLCRRDEVVLENLRAYAKGEPLNYVIDEKRFALMT